MRALPLSYLSSFLNVKHYSGQSPEKTFLKSVLQSLGDPVNNHVCSFFLGNQNKVTLLNHGRGSNSRTGIYPLRVSNHLFICIYYNIVLSRMFVKCIKGNKRAAKWSMGKNIPN